MMRCFIVLSVLVLGACSPDRADDQDGSPAEAPRDMSAELLDASPSDSDMLALVRPSIEHPCARVSSPAPYPRGVPYLTVHANPQNNDRVPCAVSGPWRPGWHALRGKPIAQPNTFSPDGLTTYVTTALRSDADCSVFALDVETGEQRWCRSIPGAINSAVAVDQRGHLYIASESSIVSLDAGGAERWTTEFYTTEPQAVGAHFTPHGELATVTQDGTVYLLSRGDGEVLGRLDLASALGFVDPKGARAAGGDRIREQLGDDLELLFGDALDDSSGTFFGSSGKFTNNTIAVDPSGNLYVTGGGPDEDNGTVIQVMIERDEEGVTLRPGFYIPLHGFSAASPVISPDGRWLKTSDGVATGAVSDAFIQLVELSRCPPAGACQPTYTIALDGAQLGASPVLDGAVHLRWETSLARIGEQTSRDLVKMRGEEVVWELDLPDSMTWSSVLTITDDYILGTATHITLSSEKIFSFTLPETATSELLVVSRADGSIVYRYPVTDDSSATVTVGPDGSLYVGMLALVHALAKETRPVAGLMKFSPLGAPK